MSNFVVSARKYRPTRFDEVVGQEHVSQTLKNALQNDHLAHAFLFCGPRGVGKTTCARILAKVINCTAVTKDHEPCNECESCQSFDRSASFNIAELDAASNNSVEHIRGLNEQVRIPPQQGNYKVFIIDEVHMLSQQAFNAFLKTLEEPPPYAIFILATTEKHKIIPTILSRCQIYDFRRIQVPQAVAHLEQICAEEQIEADNDALHIIADKADGALRDALSIFDRIVSFSGKKISYEDVIENLNVLDYDYFFRFTDALLTEDLPTVLNTFDQVLRRGFDSDIFINGLAGHFRNLLVCQNEKTLDLLQLSESLRVRYREQAQITPAGFLLTALNIANECDVNYRMARNKRLHVEMALIKMTYISRTVDLRKNPLPAVGPTAAPMAMTEKKTEYQTAAPTPPEEPSVAAASAAETTVAASVVTSSAPASVELEGTAPVAASDSETAVAESVPTTVSVPEPVRTSTLRKNSRHTLGQKVSLDALVAEIDDEKEELASVDRSRCTQKNLDDCWANYAAEVESQSLSSSLKLAEVVLKDAENLVLVRVSGPLSKSSIQQETELIALIRTALGVPDLKWEFEIDASKLESSLPARPKRLTDREKLIMMREINPQVIDLVKRLELRPK